MKLAEQGSVRAMAVAQVQGSQALSCIYVENTGMVQLFRHSRTLCVLPTFTAAVFRPAALCYLSAL